jgi:hypothetical protein
VEHEVMVAQFDTVAKEASEDQDQTGGHAIPRQPSHAQ